jgi:uncharacterized OsmC-like protein
MEVTMPEITVNHRGDMEFETQIGSHKLTIDIPPENNGKDRGPTPPQLFIASLSSCIAVFVASYCNNVGISTEDLSVTMSYEKRSNPSCLGNLKAVIRIPKEDVGKREKGVLRAAELCLIQETIRLSPEVKLTLEK